MPFQAFGWTPQEAKMHMVDDYFSPSEVRTYQIKCMFFLLFIFIISLGLLDRLIILILQLFLETTVECGC